MKTISSMITLMLISMLSYGQQSNLEMADALRSSGKIYVVVAVIGLLFVGFMIYLFSLDKRIKKIENQK